MSAEDEKIESIRHELWKLCHRTPEHKWTHAVTMRFLAERRAAIKYLNRDIEQTEIAVLKQHIENLVKYKGEIP